VSSAPLAALLAAIVEVRTLELSNPSPTGGPPQNPPLTRAIGRACVVLLSAHLERYIHAINEETVNVLLTAGVQSSSVPELIRLLHLRQPIDELARTQWTGRGSKLRDLMERESALWIPNAVPTALVHDRLVEWMRSPQCEEILRYFKQWGIDDIFSAVTRQPHTRAYLWLKLSELVNKRNNIAHGDPTSEATQADVRNYRQAVTKFCASADSVLSRRLARLFGLPRPW